MTWLELHNKGSSLAFEAGEMRRSGNNTAANDLYTSAAVTEAQALEMIPFDKIRSIAIVGVSACSLFYKARNPEAAEQLALSLLSKPIPDFAKIQLQSILQAVWNESVKRRANLEFQPGEVIVSISGPQTVYGGAPIDLVLDRIRTVQNIFYRTVEYLSSSPLRRSGPPARPIVDVCRPWIFSAPAGSYQFAVSVQGAEQKDLFKDNLLPSTITERFLQIVSASSEDDSSKLEEIVSIIEYRPIFKKLTEALRPSSRSQDRVKIYSYDYPQQITLTPRKLDDTSQRRKLPEVPAETATKPDLIITGILRALDLDRDWIIVETDSISTKIIGLQETVDDVIGPMVNRRVIVSAIQRKSALYYRDIELQD